MDYFDATYVSGRRQAQQLPNGNIRINLVGPPLFPPGVWNVYEDCIQGGHRTNNLCESWNNR